MERPPTIESVPEFSSKIDLRFFRHDKKESTKTKEDKDILLAPEGRLHAKERASLTDLGQAIAFSSPRKRTAETAGFVMAGKAGEITGTETLEELKAKIHEGIKHGSKLREDERLDFMLDEKTPYGDAATKAFGEGRFLKFLVEESDRLAEENNDTENSTYSSMARSVAEIVKKYIGIAPRWDELVNNEDKRANPFKKYDKVLHRLFATHQTIQESFLAKTIELTKGPEERDRFVAALDNQGVGFSEGFHLEIITESSQTEPTIHITYKKEGATEEKSFDFDETISAEVLEEIAQGEAVPA